MSFTLCEVLHSKGGLKSWPIAFWAKKFHFRICPLKLHLKHTVQREQCCESVSPHLMKQRSMEKTHSPLVHDHFWALRLHRSYSKREINKSDCGRLSIKGDAKSLFHPWNVPCKIECRSYTADLPVQKAVGCCCFCSWRLSTMRWKASSWLPSSGLPSADGRTSWKTIVQAHSSPRPWQDFCFVTIYGTGVWDFYLYSVPNCNRHVSSNSYFFSLPLLHAQPQKQSLCGEATRCYNTICILGSSRGWDVCEEI